MNLAQLPSTKLRGRFSVDKLTELCLMLAALSVFVPLAFFLFAAVFGKDAGAFTSWPYWAGSSVLSVALWLSGFVMAVICLVKARQSERRRVVRRQAIVGLLVEVMFFWAPLIPVVVTGWYIFGYPDWLS